MSKKEESKKSTVATIKDAVAAAGTLLRIGMSNVRFNLRLDAMQLSNAKNEYTAEARIARGEKLMKGIEDAEAKFKGAVDEVTKLPLAPVSNWKPLADYFNATLAHLTELQFTLGAQVEIGRFIKQAGFQTITEQQKAVISTFFNNRAHANWDKIQYIRAILVRKNLLKKAPAKMPTEAEVKEMQSTE